MWTPSDLMTAQEASLFEFEPIVRVDWSNAGDYRHRYSFIRESVDRSTYPHTPIQSISFRRGVEPGGDRPFTFDGAGRMSISVYDPDDNLNRYNNESLYAKAGVRIGYTRKIQLYVDPANKLIRDGSQTPTVEIFHRLVLFTGYIYTITASTSQSRMATIEAQGVFRLLNDEQLFAEAVATNTATTAVYRHIASEVDAPRRTARAVLTAANLDPGFDLELLNDIIAFPDDTNPGRVNQGKALSTWYSEGQSILEALRDIVLHEAGAMVEGRSGAVRLYAASQLQADDRFVSPQLLLYAQNEAESEGSDWSLKRREQIRRNRLRLRYTDPQASVAVPPGWLPWSTDHQFTSYPYCHYERIDTLDPEEPILNDLSVNLKSVSYAAADEDIYVHSGDIRLEPPGTVNARYGTDASSVEIVSEPSDSDVVAIADYQRTWTESVFADPTLSENVGKTPTVSISQDFKSARRWSFTLNHAADAGTEAIIVRGLKTTGKPIRADSPEARVHLEDPTSKYLWKTRSQSYDAKFFSSTPTVIQQVPSLIHPIEYAKELGDAQIGRFNRDYLRHALTVNASVAGRWALQEMLIPLNRVRVSFFLGGYERFYEAYIIGVDFKWNTGGSAMLTLILRPTLDGSTNVVHLASAPPPVDSRVYYVETSLPSVGDDR